MVTTYEFNVELLNSRRLCIPYPGAVAFECLERLAVQSLTVHLSSSTVVLLLRVVSCAAMLMEE